MTRPHHGAQDRATHTGGPAPRLSPVSLCPEIGTLAGKAERVEGTWRASCPTCGAMAPVFATSEGRNVWRFRSHDYEETTR